MGTGGLGHQVHNKHADKSWCTMGVSNQSVLSAVHLMLACGEKVDRREWQSLNCVGAESNWEKQRSILRQQLAGCSPGLAAGGPTQPPMETVPLASWPHSSHLSLRVLCLSRA